MITYSLSFPSFLIPMIGLFLPVVVSIFLLFYMES